MFTSNFTAAGADWLSGHAIDQTTAVWRGHELILLSKATIAPPLPQINSCIFNMAFPRLIKKQELLIPARSDSKRKFSPPPSITGRGGDSWGSRSWGARSSQNPPRLILHLAAARHVPSPAQLHLNTPLLPNTWLHLPLSKWKISIICLSEYPANEGFHDKLGGGSLCRGERQNRARQRLE